MEQICRNRRPPPWPARKGAAAQERNRRYPFPRRGAGRREICRAISRLGDDTARAFCQCRDAGAQSETGSRHWRQNRTRAQTGGSRCHGHRRSAHRTAPAPMLLHRAAGNRRQGDPDGQRRHRRILCGQARASERIWRGANDGCRRGGQGARTLRSQARLYRGGNSDQCRWQGTVRSGVRAILAKSRRARHW